MSTLGSTLAFQPSFSDAYGTTDPEEEESAADAAASANATANATDANSTNATDGNATVTVDVSIDAEGTDGKKDDKIVKVDGKNGELVEKDGTVKTIKDGKVVAINGEEVKKPKKETKQEKKDLEKEQKDRNESIEETGECSGWFCF